MDKKQILVFYGRDMNENFFRFANLDVIEVWKEEMARRYGREKDSVYLKKIRRFRIKFKS